MHSVCKMELSCRNFLSVFTYILDEHILVDFNSVCVWDTSSETQLCFTYPRCPFFNVRGGLNGETEDNTNLPL